MTINKIVPLKLVFAEIAAHTEIMEIKNEVWKKQTLKITKALIAFLFIHIKGPKRRLSLYIQKKFFNPNLDNKKEEVATKCV